MRTPEPLSQWLWIVCQSSGGKDSQTALRQIVLACDAQGVPRDRIVVSHQCLGRMEWPGTLELVKQQAACYNLRLEISSYRDKAGQELSLLDYVRKRGKWPSSTTRFCTSEYKRGPGGRVLTKLSHERPGPILNVYGFRAEESSNRAKKRVFVQNKRFSSGRKEVWDYLPIHNWTEQEVWEDIHGSGIPYHFAYTLGMSRLSCVLCIFSPFDSLLVAGRANPELLDEYCDVEIATGHRFRNDLALVDVRQAIKDGVQPKNLKQPWNM